MLVDRLCLDCEEVEVRERRGLSRVAHGPGKQCGPGRTVPTYVVPSGHSLDTSAGLVMALPRHGALGG